MRGTSPPCFSTRISQVFSKLRALVRYKPMVLTQFDGALAPAEQKRALGCERRVISADEAARIEPALGAIRPRLAGATYTAEDESGDAHRFARELIKLCEDAGVKFLMSHTVTALREEGGRIDHVEATDGEGRFQRLRADGLCWRWDR